MLPNETDCSGFEKTMNQYCAEVTKLTKILLHAISRSVVKVKGQISRSNFHEIFSNRNNFGIIFWYNFLYIFCICCLFSGHVSHHITQSWRESYHMMFWVESNFYCTRNVQIQKFVTRNIQKHTFDCIINRFSKSILIESIIYVPKNKV